MKSRVVVLALVMTIGCTTQAATAASRLAFSLVAEPGAVQDPKLFERTTVSSPWSREELAIARTPSLELPIGLITAATVERRQFGQAPNPQMQPALEALKEKGVVVESTQRYFALQLKLDPAAGRMLHEFTRVNVGKRVDVRLDGKRLAVAKIHDPVGESLLVFLNETDEARVRGLLSPIANRVSWK